MISKKNKATMQLPKNKVDYRLLLYILPGIIFVIMFTYIPLAGWYIAFVDFKPGISIDKTPFVGLYYFKVIFGDKFNMPRVMRNTIIFALIGYLTAPLAMILAISLNEVRNSKLKSFIQTVTTFPHFVSWVIVYSLSFQLFSFDGKLSSLLLDFGITDKATSLIANGDVVYSFQTFMGLWKGLGWSAIIYMAAIAGIDQEQFEAATIDGANRMQKIFYITVPSLMPTFIVMLMLNISSFVGVGLDQFLVFYNGAVADKIEVIDLYIHRATLMRSDYSYGTAIGMLKSIISITMLMSVNQLSKKIRGESIF